MANITPREAIIWLSGSNRGLGGEMANIHSAQYGMREFPPDSQAYQAHEQVMENSLAKVEQEMANERLEEGDLILFMARQLVIANQENRAVCMLLKSQITKTNHARLSGLFPKASPISSS